MNATASPAWASAGWIPQLEAFELPWLDELRDRHTAAVAACLAAQSAREQLDARFAAEDLELERLAVAGEPVQVDEATSLEARARQRADADGTWGVAWIALRELAAEQAAELALRLPGAAVKALEAANRRLAQLKLSRRGQVYEAIRRDDVALTALCQSLASVAEEARAARKLAEAAIE